MIVVWSVSGSPRSNEKDQWDIIYFSNSNYEGDSETWHSVSGFLLYISGVLMSWWSKSQWSMTLSSSEAKMEALLEAVKEIMFIIQILQSGTFSVIFLVTVRVHNLGATFIAVNITASCYTKHLDISCKMWISMWRVT